MQTSVVGRLPAETATDTPQLPPHAQVIQMATAYWVSRALYVAAQLGIADLLKDAAQDAEALASATGTHAPALRRVLRSLASVGLFKTDAQGRFSLTPLGAVLQSDAPGAARSTVLALSGTFFWAAWGEVLPACGPARRACRRRWASVSTSTSPSIPRTPRTSTPQ